MGTMEEFTPESNRTIEDYQPVIGQTKTDELLKMAEPLQGRGWANVNSTAAGGGVAEMLHSLVPLARCLGLDATWYVIKGHEDFFNVTKKFHNMLQGVEMDISLEEIFHAYLDTLDENAKDTFIASDMVIVHDPQPAALIMNGIIYGNILWRCHIDTSAPNPIIWRFLLPYINHCAGAIFSMPQFVGPGVQVPTYRITPGIDPLSAKNHQFTRDEALQVLEPLFNEHDIDPERPILTAVSRYDIHKNQPTILKAFKRFLETKPDPAPYLIFLGNTADDDPEGAGVLAELKKKAEGLPGVRFWVNVENNDQVVGSLMKIAQAMIHVSTKEGFGLVVAEALWQGTPVIGSMTGGIAEQVLDGRTGYLCQAMDATAIAARMHSLLTDPHGARAMGERGREHIRHNFLLTEVLRRYLILLDFYTGTNPDQIPAFRLDDLSYSEIIHRVQSSASHPLFGRKK